jgi:predicted O-methyltransferase YrrM
MKNRIDAILQRSQAQYLDSLLPPRDELLERMETFAGEHGHPISDPEVAQLLRIVVRMRQPQRILEIGTNIGYSVVVMGRECAPGTTIETIELNRPILDIASDFVAEAKLRCHVVFHEGAALEVIPKLEGSFDLVFIDCVKSEYGQYLDLMLPKMPHGGTIVCDNLLWGGKVAEEVHDPSTDALRAFNQRLAADSRLMTIILPLGDGTGLSVVL